MGAPDEVVGFGGEQKKFGLNVVSFALAVGVAGLLAGLAWMLTTDAEARVPAMAVACAIGAYANACESAADQEALDALAVTALSPRQYALASEAWVSAGATLIGGCCDTSPAFIAALDEHWRARSG